jgi:hypothetical protein
VIAIYYRQPIFRRVATWRRWCTLPVIAGCMALLLKVRAPLYLTFLVSRPAMERLAEQAMRDPNTIPKTAYVGLYPAERIKASSASMQFLVSASGFLGQGGFAYLPLGAQGDSGYQHLWGHWYTFTDGAWLFGN